MIAYVDDSLFAPGTSRMVDLVALLRTAARRGHTIIMTDRPGRVARSARFQEWSDTLRGELLREVRALQERISIIPSARTNLGGAPVLVSNQWNGRPSDCVVDLDLAIRLLGAPLAILLEHAINDGQFLLRASPPEWRKKLEAWLRDGSLVFENGGGISTMAELVRHFATEKSQTLGSGLEARLWRRRRLLVYDRDAAPERLGAGAKALRQACKAAGFPEEHQWVLDRRKQENYVPREAVVAHAKRRAPSAELPALLDEVEKHFGAPTRHGDELPRLGKEPFFKNLFMEPLDWRDEWFENDGCWSELEKLAERIATAL